MTTTSTFPHKLGLIFATLIAVSSVACTHTTKLNMPPTTITVNENASSSDGNPAGYESSEVYYTFNDEAPESTDRVETAQQYPLGTQTAVHSGSIDTAYDTHEFTAGE